MEKDDFKEFLMEEYKAFNESMHKSEETGESRLTFFYTLSTAILGAVLFFMPKTFTGESLTGKIDNQPESKMNIIYVLILVFLLCLLAIGVIIHRRLEKRNRNTDKLKEAIASIREIFKNDFSDNLASAKSYSPFPAIPPKPKREFTSLADISWVMNILILTIIVVLTIFFETSNITYSIAGGSIVIIVAPLLYMSKPIKNYFTKSKRKK